MKILKTEIGAPLNIEKCSQIIINAVEVSHEVNEVQDQTIMTIKNLEIDTEIFITKTNPIIKITLGQNTDIDHCTIKLFKQLPIIILPWPITKHNRRDTQSNAPPRSDNRYRDRSGEQDRGRTPTRQNSATHSRDSSEGRNLGRAKP